MTELKLLAKGCNFENQEESLIRDRIVLGTNDAALQERLLRVPELQLATPVNRCRAAEAGKQQSMSLQKSEVATVQTSKNKNREEANEAPYQCKECDNTHTRYNCPAYNKKCNDKVGHFAVGCKFKKEHCNKKTNYRSNTRDRYINNSKKVNKVENVQDKEEVKFLECLKID